MKSSSRCGNQTRCVEKPSGFPRLNLSRPEDRLKDMHGIIARISLGQLAIACRIRE
jgi:hypothetical protein